MLGAALGALLFEGSGVFLPTAHLERPLAEAAGVRLAANLLLCSCVAVGVETVAGQKPKR